ncbi:MAG: helix-turn-helix domain-containing protein [Deltaproteobacteria bacterium]|nr:helix-turn-helix domain-containing protein [Deltaproteobacteria bacterium]
MLRVYRFRLYPTRLQEAALEHTLDLLRAVYNAALEERIRGHRHRQEALARSSARVPQKITGASQEKALTEIKHDCAAYKKVHTHLLQDAVKRLDKAFHAFFRRVQTREKAGEKAGFPSSRAGTPTRPSPSRTRGSTTPPPSWGWCAVAWDGCACRASATSRSSSTARWRARSRPWA